MGTLAIVDDYGFVTRGIKSRANIKPIRHVEPVVHRISVNLKTGSRVVERNIITPALIEIKPDYDAIQRETLERENAEMRKFLDLRDQPHPIGRIVGARDVINSFLERIQAAGFEIDGEPYGLHHLMSKRRAKRYCKPRHVAIWLCCRLCKGYSLPTLAKAFRMLDHTSISHAQDHVESAFAWNPILREIAAAVIAEYASQQEAP